MGSPALGTALRVCSISAGQRKDHLPRLAGGAGPDAAQGTGRLFYRSGWLLAHVQPGVSQHLQVLLRRAAFLLVGPQRTLVGGLFPPSRVQDLTFPFGERDEIALGPFLQSVGDALRGSTPTGCISRSSILCHLHKMFVGSIC